MRGVLTPLFRAIPLALLSLLIACADAPLPREAGGGDGEPRYGGIAVVAGPSDLGPMNSLVPAPSYTGELIRFALFMTPVRFDAQLDYAPYLARSWELLGDSGVVFHLRNDVYWHDGVKTTAYDMAFTYRRIKDPATGFPNASYFGHWGKVEVVDSFTIRFSFEPHQDPLAGWALTSIMPEHLLGDIPPAELANAPFNYEPIGNGPFRFVSYEPNDRWVFEANPAFPAELGGRPYLDRLVWRVIPENTSQVTELIAGNVDLITSARSERITELDAEPGLRAIVRPSRRFAFIGWNGQREPFDDPRVRRALTLAIDRRAVLNVLRSGYGTLASGPILPSHWAYADSINPLPYDPEAARALLAEAGVRDRDGDNALELPSGEAVTFTLKVLAQNAFNQDVATMLQADLARIGIDMSVRATEATTLISDISSAERRFDAVLMGWSTDFRLSMRDLYHSDALGGPFQLASYSNPEIDSILDRVATMVDRDAAVPLWHRLQAILRREQPWSYLYYYPDLYVVREQLNNVSMDIRGMFVNVDEWWLDSVE